MAAAGRVERYTQALYDGKDAVIAVADAEQAELQAALQRVRAIHEPIDAMNYRGGMPRPARVCTGCGTDDGNWQHWPCPTVRALGALDGDS